MKSLLPVFVLWLLPLAVCRAAPASHIASPLPAAPYLLPGAPTFDLTITQFRSKFDTTNPTLPLSEFRAVENSQDRANLTRAATRINENLYASTALERGTLKIKSIQLTWLPIHGPEQKGARSKALEYMAALIHSFTPSLSKTQSQQKLSQLLIDGRNKRYFSRNDGAIRYVVADKGEKGLTFAIEPIKLVLTETPNDGNK